RNPSASPIRQPLLEKTANKKRSRRCSHASKIACTSAVVSTRGSFFGTFNAIVRRTTGALLLMRCRNGFHPPPPPPAGCPRTSNSATVRGGGGGGGENALNADSFRFTVDSVQ